MVMEGRECVGWGINFQDKHWKVKDFQIFMLNSYKYYVREDRKVPMQTITTLCGVKETRPVPIEL